MTDFENSGSECQCMAFWPVMILSLGIIVSSSVGLVGGLKQKKQLAAIDSQFQQVQPEIVQLGQKLEAVSNDILAMSATNASAAQLVKEFNIRKQDQGASATPAPAAKDAK